MRRSTSARSRREAPPDSAPPEFEERPAALLELQRAAGNRAVAALLAREPAPGWSFSPVAPAAPKAPNLNLPVAAMQERLEDVRAKVRAHLEGRRAEIEGRIRAGVSIAEVLDLVLQAVPEGRELAPQDLEAQVRAFFRPLDISTHRDPADRRGAVDEIAAMARNALGAVKGATTVNVGMGGVVSVGISGVSVGLGAPEGGRRDGDRPVEATLGWDRSVALTTRSGGVVFTAKVTPPGETGDVAWEVGLQFPGDDAMVPLLATLPDVFSKAERGMRDVAVEARRGGPGSFDRAKQKLAPVKEAVSAASAVAAKHSGPRFGLSAQGEGGGLTVQATLTFVF